MKKQIIRNCTVCGKKIKVTVYPDRKYRGGHYFGEIKTEKTKRLSTGNVPYVTMGIGIKRKGKNRE